MDTSRNCRTGQNLVSTRVISSLGTVPVVCPTEQLHRPHRHLLTGKFSRIGRILRVLQNQGQQTEKGGQTADAASCIGKQVGDCSAPAVELVAHSLSSCPDIIRR